MAALTEEQSILKDQASSWVETQLPVQKFREFRNSNSDGGFDPEAWSAMVDMGWTGILVGENYGGSDLGYLTFGLILEQLGRQLCASPLFASAYVGATAINLGGSDAQKQHWLPKIVDGSEILTLAVDEESRHHRGSMACTATTANGGYTLNGAKTFVLEGMSATSLIVAASTADGSVQLFLVPADSAGVTRQPMQTIDSRDYARLSLTNVAVAADAHLGALSGDSLYNTVLDRACAGVAMEMLGVGCYSFEMTLDYLKTRKQFGKVIGSFQALGHRAAELYSAQEMARSCAEAGVIAIDQGADDEAAMSALSKAKTGEFLFDMSNQLIQIHGGIGMTDEFDAGLYLKRARVLETTYGNQAMHRDRYATLLGF
jgi:alkylation response protein AidB-like acyl-CoA dehydrogenase